MLRQDLDACHQRAVNRLADLGEEADIHLVNTVDLCDAVVCDLGGEQVVDLADMVDRVFSARCLHAHGTVGGDQPVAAVATPHGPVVTHLGRGPGHGQVDTVVLDIIRRVHVDNDFAFRLFLCDLHDLL